MQTRFRVGRGLLRGLAICLLRQQVRGCLPAPGNGFAAISALLMGCWISLEDDLECRSIARGAFACQTTLLQSSIQRFSGSSVTLQCRSHEDLRIRSNQLRFPGRIIEATPARRNQTIVQVDCGHNRCCDTLSYCQAPRLQPEGARVRLEGHFQHIFNAHKGLSRSAISIVVKGGKTSHNELFESSILPWSNYFFGVSNQQGIFSGQQQPTETGSPSYQKHFPEKRAPSDTLRSRPPSASVGWDNRGRIMSITVAQT